MISWSSMRPSSVVWCASGSGACPPQRRARCGAGQKGGRGWGGGVKGCGLAVQRPHLPRPGLRRKCPSPSTPGQRRAGCFLLLVWAQQWVQQFGAPPSGSLLTNYVVLTPSRRHERSTGATGCRTLQMSDGGDSFRCLDICVVILCSLSSETSRHWASSPPRRQPFRAAEPHAPAARNCSRFGAAERAMQENLTNPNVPQNAPPSKKPRQQMHKFGFPFPP